ncbi:MAG: hypothetical protein OXC94_05240 [Chloroflexi bacterium]|nr:hypothetical protein [Chloroflexota bacterium]
MGWTEPPDPPPNSWRRALAMTIESYGILFGFFLFALGGIALVGLAFVLFALHALAGLAYLALGVAILITLSLRDRRRGPPAP